MDNSKKWYASKTIWFNVLSFGWQFVGPKIGLPTLDDQTFGVIVTVANILLRILTKGAVTIA